MNIREANSADAIPIKGLVFGILDEYGLQSDSESIDKDLDDLEKYYSGNNGYFAVVEENSTIVATVGILKVNDSICELRKMYILPSSRGKGLGKLLLEHAVLKAKDLGYDTMTLETASALKEAISLYKKYGFKEYYPDHLSDRCDHAFKFNLTTSQAQPG